eukprot:GHVQ01014774.1.p1 GENE.GHVQ01014774.1~~GHVQ01014774.1.p1  ORF type:complete len:377 (+),score=45.31 GHVQ01014774.1:762-1892(+)
MGLVSVLNTLASDEDLSIATSAGQALLELCRCHNQPVLDKLLRKEFMDPIEKGLHSSEDMEVKVRVFQLFVSLGAVSERAFEYFEERIFKLLLSAYFSDDLLVKLNVVELINQLGQTPKGVEMLSREDMPRKLVRDLSPDALLDDAGRVCVLNVISNILRMNPTLVEDLVKQNGTIMNTLEEFLICPRTHTNFIALRRSGLYSWGNICSTPQGLKAIESRPDLTALAAESLADSSCETSVPVASMCAWTSVLSSHRVVEDEVVLKVLSVILRQPFNDIRVHGYELLTALMMFPFAARRLCLSKDHVRLLTDFLSENDIHSKYAKHTLVKTIVSRHREWLTTEIDTDVLRDLDAFAAGGPFFVPLGASATVDKQAAS